MSSTQKEIKFIFLMSLFMVVILMFPHYPDTEASVGGTYFGGKISSMVTCTCNTDGSSQVTLKGSKSSSGTYLYVPANKTYAKHMVKQGNYLLGKSSAVGVCMVGVLPTCTELPISKGTITYIGTSF